MAKGRILIVEDQSVVSQNIMLMLKYNGYEVSGIAATSEEAFQMIQSDRPDLIIMDISLPGNLDGIDATKIINERWNIPVIYLTAHSDEITLQRAKNTPNYGFIVKDFDLKTQIPIFIDFALYKHQLEEQQEVIARALEESEEMFRVIVNSLRDAIMFIDKNGWIPFWNKSALKIFGYSKEESEKIFLSQIINITDVEIYNTQLSKIEGGLKTEYTGKLLEFDAIRKDGTTFPTESTFYPIKIKNKWYSCCSIRDITIRKTVELEKARLIEELHLSKDIIEQNANDLLLTNEKLFASEENLRILNASKDRFFSILAHDLRGPFQGLIGFAKILHSDFDKLKKNEVKDIINDLYDSSEQIYKLLDHLLIWSKLQRGLLQYNPERFNIKSLVDYNIELLKPLATKKNIALLSDINVDIEFESDPNMINTVIRNLISNSIKFTCDGGEIKTSAKFNDDSSLSVCIKDNGIGIQEGDMKKLFRIDTYFTNPGTTGEKGTGLGLVLCKELIEKCNGRIFAERNKDRGCSFTFILPQKNGLK